MSHISRIIDSNTKPWIELPGSAAKVKVLAVDDENKNVLMIISMPEGSSYPNHIHHCIAIAYTLEGTWEYDEGVLTPGVVAYEPDQSAHAPKVGKGGATVFVVLDGKDEHFIDFLREDGSPGLVQDMEYFRTMQRCAESGEPMPKHLGRRQIPS